VARATLAHGPLMAAVALTSNEVTMTTCPPTVTVIHVLSSTSNEISPTQH
jgi:hypothetical protein